MLIFIIQRRCAAARLLGKRFRNRRGWDGYRFWMFCVSGRGLCGGPITCPEESYRVCTYVSLWSGV